MDFADEKYEKATAYAQPAPQQVQAAPTQSTSPIHARQRFPSDSTGAPISLASDELDKVYSKWFYGLAIALIPVAFIQFSVAAAAFSIPTGGMGFLWAGLFTLITCVLALFTKNHFMASITLSMGILAIVFVFVGMIVDGAGWGRWSAMSACFEQDTGKEYGTTSDKPFLCESTGSSMDCLCVKSAATAEDSTCYGANLRYDADDCGMLLKPLPAELATSWVFCFLMFFPLLALLVVTSLAARMCGSSSGGSGGSGTNSSSSSTVPPPNSSASLRQPMTQAGNMI